MNDPLRKSYTTFDAQDELVKWKARFTTLSKQYEHVGSGRPDSSQLHIWSGDEIPCSLRKLSNEQTTQKLLLSGPFLGDFSLVVMPRVIALDMKLPEVTTFRSEN